MHAREPARVLPRRGRLPELAEVVIDVRLRKTRHGSRGRRLRAEERGRWRYDEPEDVGGLGAAGRGRRGRYVAPEEVVNVVQGEHKVSGEVGGG